MKRMATRRKPFEEYLKQPYSRVLIPEEEGGYSAEILEFPGCYSQGETAEEALQNIDEAATNWIEATLAAGNPVPPPSTDYQYAGKIALRLPRSLHRQAVRLAGRDGVSLNQWLVTAIAARLGAEELYTRMAERIEGAWTKGAFSADADAQVKPLWKGSTQDVGAPRHVVRTFKATRKRQR
jgi:predicted RNase H-like HicB family nuclease